MNIQTLKSIQLRDVYPFLAHIIAVCILFKDHTYELYEYKCDIPEEYRDWYIVGFGATRVTEDAFNPHFKTCEEFFLVETITEWEELMKRCEDY